MSTWWICASGLVVLAVAFEWWGLHARQLALQRANEGEAEDASDEVHA